MIGRIVPAYLADLRFGALNVLIPGVLLSAITLFCWAAVDTKSGLWAFASIYGLFAAVIQSMWPSTLATYTVDLKKAGVRMGMGFSVSARGLCADWSAVEC